MADRGEQQQDAQACHVESRPRARGTVAPGGKRARARARVWRACVCGEKSGPLCALRSRVTPRKARGLQLTQRARRTRPQLAALACRHACWPRTRTPRRRAKHATVRHVHAFFYMGIEVVWHSGSHAWRILRWSARRRLAAPWP